MSLRLDAAGQELLGGEAGEGSRLAMSILVRMAGLAGARELLEISGAHIDSSLYQGPATLEFAERLAGGGARVRVPTTLNVAGVDVHGWRDWAVPEDWAEPARRHMEAYERMGCRPTWTCAPYQALAAEGSDPGPARPGFGEQVAWGESSAIVFANSVLGARTERYPDLMDICCAVTGRVPAAGLHLDENRIGQDLIRLDRIPARVQEDEAFWPVFGHWVGGLVGNRVPVIDGLTVGPTEDHLKALGAAMASSGAVALFHIPGVTPEAPTRAAAFAGAEPERTFDPDLSDLRAARRDLSTAEGDDLDLVVLGSPHFSLEEFRVLAPLLEGRRRHPDVRFLVTTGRGVRAVAEASGLMAPCDAFGAELTLDTCILTTPMLPPEVETLMTNSAKFAYYTPGLLGRSVAFGTLADCVESAVAGRVVIDEAAWSG